MGVCFELAKFKMSEERLEELKQELIYLQTVREKEVAELIKEARSFGDLSENSEYDEAKTEQGLSLIHILLGAETNLYLSDGDIQFTGVVQTGTVSCKMGDKVKVCFDTRKIHLFDYETEKTITN